MENPFWRFGVFCADYAREHLLTSGLLLASCLGLTVLVPLAWSYYRDRATILPVHVGALSKSQSIRSVALNIQRGENGSDKLGVVLSLVTPSDADARRTLVVSVPKRFKLSRPSVDSGSWKIVSNADDEGRVDYYITPTPANRETIFGLSFLGAVFPTGPSVDLRLSVSAFQNGAALDLPTDVTLSGLSELTLDQLIPEPKQRTANFVRYTADSWQRQTGDNTVTIRGIDRTMASGNQFRLFVVATLIGVLISTVVNGIHTLLLEFEGRGARPLQGAGAAIAAQSVATTDRAKQGG